METRTYKVYKFSELNAKQKEKVIDHYYDINVNYDWWDFTYEDAKNIGLELTGFDIDRGSYCEGKFIWDALEVAEAIIKDHGNKTETFQTANKYWQQLKKENDTNDEADTREETEKEFLHDILEDYLVMLRHEFEYLTSKEAIIETIEANDYDFTENGRID
jgi:hypothetical protein